MGESRPRSCAQTSLRSVCTYDLSQESPIYRPPARLIRAKYGLLLRVEDTADVQQ